MLRMVLPATKKSANSIMKRIKDIQEKVPAGEKSNVVDYDDDVVEDGPHTRRQVIHQFHNETDQGHSGEI